MNKKKSGNARLPWYMRDLDFVPKNKNVRIALFVILNIILLAAYILTVMCIAFPYGYVCWIPLSCILFFIYRRAFFVHVYRYPLNSYEDYKFNVKKDLLNDKNGRLVFEIRKSKNSLYIVDMYDKQLNFDMKGCFFPITIIRCYLIRKFLMFHINKNKMISDYMAKNIDISSSLPNCKDIILEYHNGNKIKRYILVKSYFTKQRLIDKIINSYGFVTWGRGTQRRFIKISEDMFIDIRYK